MVHLYNGILLSHKKEWIWVSWTELDESRACDVEWSKSDREKQIFYVNAYIWSLEKMVLIFLQGRNGDADVENGFADTAGGGEAGRNWESSTEKYILPCVKQMLAGSCCLTQGAQPGVLWWPRGVGWSGVEGRLKREGKYSWTIPTVVWQTPTKYYKAKKYYKVFLNNNIKML